MADWFRPIDAIPHYDETARNAVRVCGKQLFTKDATATSAPQKP
jgi:hypothetical protein